MIDAKPKPNRKNVKNMSCTLYKFCTYGDYFLSKKIDAKH